jgi:PAS domain S-box
MIDTVRDYAILQLDADGNVASWNRGAELLKGYRADEILGKHFSLFYPPEDIANGKPEREMAEVRAHGRMEDVGWRVRRDGSRFWGDVVITALYDAAGKIEGYVKLTRDMTQSRQVLHRLQAADRLNTAILDGAAYAIIATDPAGTITVFNRAAERMLGYAAGAMIGKQTPAILHDASEVAACAAELSQTLQRPIEPGFEVFVARARQNQPDQREWTYIRRDGSRFPVSLAVSALCDADGAVVGFLGIAQDITERRQHEAELAVLFEQSPNATFLIDAQGRVQKLNSQAIALFGYAREELRGQPVEILLPDNLRADHIAHRSHYAKAPRTRAMGADMALSARRRNGEVFPVEVMLAPIEIGGETHTLAIARDVTERKQQEAAQQKSLREKEVLLQEIHHRVKNNLQVIYSLLDLQADTVDDAATLTLLRDAQARVHAMALIHQTLYQSNNFVAVDLGSYLNTLLNDFAASHSRPEIRLDTQLDTVYLDVQSAVPCGLLINELLTNAYKHAFPDRRSGTLSVSLCQHENRVQLIGRRRRRRHDPRRPDARYARHQAGICPCRAIARAARIFGSPGHTRHARLQQRIHPASACRSQGTITR